MKTLKELQENIHWHFEILAYTEKTADGKSVKDGTLIDILEADNEAEALVIAKARIDRPHYQIRRVWQCKQCGFQEQYLAQLEKLNKSLAQKE